MVCYDILNDRKRRRVQKILEGHGERVQFSVFECDLTQGQLGSLKRRLRAEINLETDSLRFYSLCGTCSEKIEFLGNGTVGENEMYFIV